MPYITSFDGTKIHYEVVGRGKTPLFLIMGLGMDKRGWIFQVPYLSDDFLIFLVDNRGIGNSDIPEGFFSTADMAQDIYEIMKKEGIQKANFVGISMGGMILQKFASKYKDMVNKLVLVCTLHKLDDHEKQLIRDGLKFAKGIEVDKIDENILKQYINMLLDTDPERVLRYISKNLFSKEFASNNLDFVFDFFADYIRNGFKVKGFLKQLYAVLEHDSTEDLKEIKSDTLVLTGDADRMVPVWKSEFIAKNIPSAKLKIIKGGSHALNFERYEEFNKDIRDFILS
ncbi:MAG: alpha/beta hydrolase [bacterium]|nr:alpha/beta hydrolase [bacterium]